MRIGTSRVIQLIALSGGALLGGAVVTTGALSAIVLLDSGSMKAVVWSLFLLGVCLWHAWVLFEVGMEVRRISNEHKEFNSATLRIDNR